MHANAPAVGAIPKVFPKIIDRTTLLRDARIDSMLLVAWTERLPFVCAAFIDGLSRIAVPELLSDSPPSSANFAKDYIDAVHELLILAQIFERLIETTKKLAEASSQGLNVYHETQNETEALLDALRGGISDIAHRAHARKKCADKNRSRFQNREALEGGTLEIDRETVNEGSVGPCAEDERALSAEDILRAFDSMSSDDPKMHRPGSALSTLFSTFTRPDCYLSTVNIVLALQQSGLIADTSDESFPTVALAPDVMCFLALQAFKIVRNEANWNSTVQAGRFVNTREKETGAGCPGSLSTPLYRIELESPDSCRVLVRICFISPTPEIHQHPDGAEELRRFRQRCSEIDPRLKVNWFEVSRSDTAGIAIEIPLAEESVVSPGTRIFEGEELGPLCERENLLTFERIPEHAVSGAPSYRVIVPTLFLRTKADETIFKRLLRQTDLFVSRLNDVGSDSVTVTFTDPPGGLTETEAVGNILVKGTFSVVVFQGNREIHTPEYAVASGAHYALARISDFFQTQQPALSPHQILVQLARVSGRILASPDFTRVLKNLPRSVGFDLADFQMGIPRLGDETNLLKCLTHAADALKGMPMDHVWSIDVTQQPIKFGAYQNYVILKRDGVAFVSFFSRSCPDKELTSPTYKAMCHADEVEMCAKVLLPVLHANLNDLLEKPFDDRKLAKILRDAHIQLPLRLIVEIADFVRTEQLKAEGDNLDFKILLSEFFGNYECVCRQRDEWLRVRQKM